MSRRPWFGSSRWEDTRGKKKDRGKGNRLRRRRVERAWKKEEDRG
jgi:hypothetical protein